MTDTYTLLLAPNSSLMTGPGTNTIVLGGGVDGATVIDPGDENTEHLEAIIREGSRRGGIRRILITHGHPDHQGGAEALRQRTGAPVYAFNRQGTSAADHEVPDGIVFPVGGDTLLAIHTPGHRFDHLVYLLQGERVLFAGDLISGITTNVIIPPEGDMFDYLASLTRLQGVEIAEIVPAHGPTIADAQAKLAEYISHRLQREQQVLDALQELSSATVPALVELIYVDVDPRLHPVAAWTVEAHLLKLEREGRVKRAEEGKWSRS